MTEDAGSAEFWARKQDCALPEPPEDTSCVSYATEHVLFTGFVGKFGVSLLSSEHGSRIVQTLLLLPEDTSSDSIALTGLAGLTSCHQRA